ncbi:hypothetical protein [Azohydromonas aeria]|uniref:hypothetical protein n=1 Tax=Azohydromonas aeria TaxID=2590212 RepID=UPI0012FB1E62|nr:hypothetical protein [Azohydromonas aeria]
MMRSSFFLSAAALALVGLASVPARADVQWSVGVGSFVPGVTVGTVISTTPLRPAVPVYVAPPGVGYSPPPPVYVSPPPLYVPRPPAYVAPPPVYYAPPPIYTPPPPAYGPPVYVPAAPRFIGPPPVYTAAPVYIGAPGWGGGHRHHWRR